MHKHAVYASRCLSLYPRHMSHTKALCDTQKQPMPHARMCGCMYMCMFVDMYACMHVCLYVCMYVSVGRFACLPVCRSVGRRPAGLPACLPACLSVCLSVCQFCQFCVSVQSVRGAFVRMYALCRYISRYVCRYVYMSAMHVCVRLSFCRRGHG